MWRTGRTTAAAAAVLLATGCAAAGAAGLGDPGLGYPGLAGAGQTGTLAVSGAPAGPATVTRQQAMTLARTLLGRAPLPRGARPMHGRPPAAVAQPGSTELGQPTARLHRLWTIAGPVSPVYKFWSGRVPTAMMWTGNGQGSDHGTITEESVSYAPRRLPAGVYAASLTMTAAPAGTAQAVSAPAGTAQAGTAQAGTVIRADVQVIWYPPRSAAEYVPPGTGAVTITASALNPHPQGVTRTITSGPVIRRLAAMLNGAHAMPSGMFFSCPMQLATYRLAFAKKAGATPFLTATDTSCPGVQVTAGGRAQPGLRTPAGLPKLMQSLTHGAVLPSPPLGAPVRTQPR